MLKVYQKNLARCQSASTLFIQHFISSKGDIALIQEPYNLTKTLWNNRYFKCYFKNNNSKSIILVRKTLKALPIFTQETIVVLRIKSPSKIFVISSIYIPPTTNILTTIETLKTILLDFQTQDFIFGGDFNARSLAWGDTCYNEFGYKMMDFLTVNGLELHNVNTLPTFQNTHGSSVIDLTFSTQNIYQSVCNWQIHDIFDNSDHRTISFDISTPTMSVPEKEFFSYISSKNIESFLTSINSWEITSYSDIEDINNYIDNFTNYIYTSSKCSKKPVKEFNSVPWWNDEIRSLRNQTRATRRRYQRTTDIDKRAALRQCYLKLKRKLCYTIRSEKIKSWAKFLSRNQKKWDKAFQIVFNKKKTSPMFTEVGNRHLDLEDPLRIIQTFFPPRDMVQTTFANLENEQIPPITIQEIDGALKSLKRNGAPGKDTIQLSTWKIVHKERPTIFLSMFNDILFSKTFPKVWKEAKIILIPKNEKNLADIGNYRPISLLSTLSKIYEKILLNRLTFHLNTKLNKNQFGFRPGISTIDALERLYSFHKETSKKLYTHQGLLFMDIKGAFNNFNINYCLQQLLKLECPHYLFNTLATFLQNRKLYLNDYCYTTSNGTPQGSSLSPLLWNIVMNGLLESIPNSDCYIVQAYADDLVFYTRERLDENIEEQFAYLTHECDMWAQNSGVTFAYEKCQLLYDVENNRPIDVYLNGQKIQPITEVKYLGIHLNYSFNPIHHLQKLHSKIFNATCKFQRLFGKRWGLANHRLKEIYLQVLEPITTYACAVWYKNYKYIDKRLNSIQRFPLLKLAKTFRTCSTPALQILTGILPLHLRVKAIWQLRNEQKKQRFYPLRKPNIFPGTNPFSQHDEDPNYEDLELFTDGSRNEDGTGSSLVVMFKGKQVVTYKFKLDPNINSFQAEVYALKKACSFLNVNKLSANIFTDSKSAIQSLISEKRKDEICCRIIEKQNNFGKIKLNWVKAHQGDLGNSLADTAAKEAIYDGKESRISLSKAYFKQRFAKEAFDKWSIEWNNSKKGRATYHYYPAPSFSRLKTNFFENQILTNHGYFPRYFSRFKLRNISCFCGTKEADNNHYLDECHGVIHITYQLKLDDSQQTQTQVFKELGIYLSQRYHT